MPELEQKRAQLELVILCPECKTEIGDGLSLLGGKTSESIVTCEWCDLKVVVPAVWVKS